MNFRRNYLSAAVVAALAGGGVSGDAGAVTLSQDDIGDVGIVPYYTMRDGWATDFYIVNTSGSTTAAKVRFHEARNSREVLDFIVVLSPYDMINFWAALDGTTPLVKFPAGNGENSCVVPIPDGRAEPNGVGGSLPFSDIEYTGANYDKWPSSEQAADYGDLGTIDRALEGYVTIIEMGTTEEGQVYEDSLHPTPSNDVSDDNPNCTAVAEAFRDINIVDTYYQFDRNLNNLKVGFSLTNVGTGVQGSGSATMLANFATDRSAIAHTITSIQAGGADTDAANTAVTVATAAVGAASANVIKAKGNLCASDAPGGACNAAMGTQCTTPNDSATPPPGPLGVVCAASLVTAYDDALGALADANNALADANQALAAAVAATLAAPRNLIHAQSGKTAYGDPEAGPSLNNGDFFAYWFRDGQYRRFGNYDKLPDSFNLPFGLWVGLYPRPVDAVTALLMKSDVINEWAYNANTGATTDMIVTAPTKRWYTDWKNVYANEPHLVGISPILANEVANVNYGWPPFSEQFSNNGRACDEVYSFLFNNDEVGPADPILPSPSPTLDLCWETNVLYTGSESLFGSKVGTRFFVRSLFGDIPENETYNGWIDLGMTASATNYHPAIPLLNATLPNIPSTYPFDEIVQLGMPYIGFSFKIRDLGIPSNAYGGLTPHSYLRNWDKRNALGGTITLEDLGVYGPVLIPSVLSWFETNPITPIDNR
jgi:hypothetical protein